jgi:hypothetical protein
MSEENFSDDAFKSQLDIESLLLMHMNRIAINRDTNLKQYCSSVETLILLCPRFIREKAMQQVVDMGLHRGDYSNITDEKRVQYDDLFMYISELLEKQRMIWRKRSVRTFA